MNSQELTLNIAVNLGRIGRWATEGRSERVNQFLEETSEYLAQLTKAQRSEKFEPTFQAFTKSYRQLSSEVHLNAEWADDMFTWANILTHRAQLT